MRAADPILAGALFFLLLLLLLLLLRPLGAAWTTREGEGCCRWPPGQDPDPLPGWCSGPASLVGHPRCPRDAPLQASFSTPPGTTPPANDKPTPDWTAFFSFIVVLVCITLGLIAWHCKERWCGEWRSYCCPGSSLLESPFQMDDLPQSLMFPLTPNLHPYFESLIYEGLVNEPVHIDPLIVECVEDNPASGSVVHRTLPSHAPDPGPLPDPILDALETVLEPRPFADPCQGLIVGTPGEEKLHA